MLSTMVCRLVSLPLPPPKGLIAVAKATFALNTKAAPTARLNLFMIYSPDFTSLL